MKKGNDQIADDAIVLVACDCGAPSPAQADGNASDSTSHDNPVDEAIKRHVLRILQLPHWKWIRIALHARSRPRREAQAASDSESGDPHIDLAQVLESLDDDAISAVWQSWLEPREPWLLCAFEETDAMPQQYDGGSAFASGASRVKAAIPFSCRHMLAPSDRLALRLLHIGIGEEDPSFNQYFVVPAVWQLGPTRVLKEYTAVFEAGDDIARAGVLAALYQTRMGELPREGEEASEAQRLLRALRLHAIDAFLEGDDLQGSQLRRGAIAMITSLDLQSFRSTEERKRCYETALASGDDYVRDRAEMMRGDLAPTHSLPPKPWWKFW